MERKVFNKHTIDALLRGGKDCYCYCFVSKLHDVCFFRFFLIWKYKKTQSKSAHVSEGRAIKSLDPSFYCSLQPERCKFHH